jgi:hypothetical protein
MKKLRQKEQRLKDLKDEDVAIQLPEMMDGATCSPGIQSFKAVSDLDLHEQEESQYIQFPLPVTSETGNSFNANQSVEDVSCDSGPEMDKGVVLRQQVISRHHLGKTEKLAQNSIVSSSAIASKQPALARPSNYRDPHVCSLQNRNKTWARKVQAEIEKQCLKQGLDVDDEHNMAPSKNSRVLIGSISVAIEDSEHLKDLRTKNDPVPPSSQTLKHASVKVMRPVTHEENKNENIPHIDGNSAPAEEKHSCFSGTTDESSYPTCRGADLAEGEHLRRTMFSSKEAAAFLSQSKHLTSAIFTLPLSFFSGYRG